MSAAPAEIEPPRELSDFHRADLRASAISDDVLDALGVYSGSAGWLLPWADGVEALALPVYDRDKRPADGRKAAWPKGRTVIVNRLREVESDRALVVEGIRQSLAAASWAPEGSSVYGINGCDGIHAKIADRLTWARGRDVTLSFDADQDTNERVRGAVERVAALLVKAGATSVRMIKLPAELVQDPTDGLDDVLARTPAGERTALLGRLIEAAREVGPKARTLRAQRASEITPRATRWIWAEPKAPWLPQGGLALLAGREGVGKSTVAYGLTAQITQGTLPGHFEGDPRSVIIAATEDAWEQTVIPRLLACGADLDRVFRVDAVTPEGYPAGLSLPEDVGAIRRICDRESVGLLLLDPLIGAVGTALDSHKDHDVRRALEPLSRLAHDAGISIVGLIHVNKSQGADLLTRIMASRAFAAVARVVLFAAQEDTIPGPGEVSSAGEARETFLFGQIKNNLAAKVPYAVRYTITGERVGSDEALGGAPIYGSRIVWGEKVTGSIQDIVRTQESRTPERETAADRAADWLEGYLTEHGPTPAREVKAAGVRKGHAERTIQRVLGRVGVKVVMGAGNVSLWGMPGATGATGAAGATGATGATQVSASEGGVAPVAPVAPLPPRDGATLGATPPDDEADPFAGASSLCGRAVPPPVLTRPSPARAGRSYTRKTIQTIDTIGTQRPKDDRP